MILLLTVSAPFVALFLTMLFFRLRAWKRRRWALGRLVLDARLLPHWYESQASLRRRYAEHVDMQKRIHRYAGHRRNDV